jgi:hypothetical protein
MSSLKDPTILGETYGFWCQTLVLLGAAILAWLAIINSRRIERRKAAISVLISSKRDENLTNALRKIIAVHREEKNMASFAKQANLGTEESKAIRYALNHYEYISVGIFHQIFDEKIFKSSSYTTIVNLYERTKPYIEQARKEKRSQTTFQEFECLACRWKEKPLKHKPIKSIERNWLNKWF